MGKDIVKLNELKNLLWSGDTNKIQEKYNEILNSSNIEVLNLMKTIMVMTTSQAITAIDEYIESKISERQEPKEEISRIFGIDISEIEHKRLDTGLEIFAFYDKKLGRKRFIENPENSKSLTQQLKEIQNTDEYYQGEKDYKDNATSMLKTFPYELELIDIVDINDYETRINGLEERERLKLNKLLSNKDINEIRYINLENSLALSKDGSIIESVITENKILPDSEEVKLETPKEYNYNIDEMSSQEKENDDLENELSEGKNDNTQEITFNDLEDIPELIEAELAQKYYRTITKEELNKIKTNIIQYYKNPDLMINLEEKERVFYEKFVSILSNKIEARKSKSSQIQYTYEEKNGGFLNIIFISIIVIILVLIILLFIKNK